MNYILLNLIFNKMSDFQLYNNLIKDLPSKKLTIKEKRDFIEKIPILNENGNELLYVLIRIFEKRKKKKENKLPFSSKSDIDNEITFDINEFPNKLSQLLYKFINLHISSSK
tara:strand:+ start:1675 stop:2010 length:336 start_codon:yes stop_codon:yes gene_type:complete